MPIRLVPCVKADLAVEARCYSIAMVEHLPPNYNHALVEHLPRRVGCSHPSATSRTIITTNP
ncbi:hypothetical protein KAJ77_10690, partial [bacterium]|nr:hypothetical protein [bacterium]